MAQAEFQKAAIKTYITLNSNIKTHLSNLDSIGSYFTGSNHVNEEEFEAFTKNYSKLDGVLAVCFCEPNGTEFIRYGFGDCEKYEHKSDYKHFPEDKAIAFGLKVKSSSGQAGIVNLVINLLPLTKSNHFTSRGQIDILNMSEVKESNSDNFTYVDSNITSLIHLDNNLALVYEAQKSQYNQGLSNLDILFLVLIGILFILGAYAYEVSLRHRAREEQAHRLEELNEIVSATPSCLKVITREGLLLDMNKQGLDLIETDCLESVYKANVYDIVEESHREKFKAFNERICDGAQESLVFEIIGLQGTRRWMETYAAPYTLKNGEIGHVAITNDITEKVNSEKEYQDQKLIAQHRAKLASIGELAAGVGHEINNPLSIIQGYVKSISKVAKEKKTLKYSDLSDYVEKIDTSIERISRILTGLRTFSRSDATDNEPFLPGQAIEESFNMLEEIYQKEGIELTLFKESLPENIFVEGNRGKFQQILMNLISNAKHAVEDKEDKHIQIRYSHENDIMKLEVKDSGAGIPDNLKNRIFDPFFTTKDVSEGTGIGLSLVHNFVTELGGKIHVESEYGMGSSFIVELPVLIQDEAPQLDNVVDLPPMKNSFKATAILADDEEDIRIILGDLLTEMGIDVTCVENGKQALDLYKKDPSKFDLIISDMKMPEMSGPKLLRHIRGDKSIKQPRFVFVTGGININFEDKDNELNQMIDGYIFKPFKEDEINKLLLSCIDGEEFKKAA